VCEAGAVTVAAVTVVTVNADVAGQVNRHRRSYCLNRRDSAVQGACRKPYSEM